MNPSVGACDRRIGTITMRQENGGEIYLFPIKKFIQVCIALDARIFAEPFKQHLSLSNAATTLVFGQFSNNVM